MAVTPGVGAMSEAEVTRYIKESRCGVLTLVDGNRPYGVPVEHYYDGKALYFLTSPREGQRKMEAIKKNANACFVIHDSRRDKPEIVEKGIRCRSVVIEGRIGGLELKDLTLKDGSKAKIRMLRLDIDAIGNWVCPRKSCDFPTPWFERFPGVAPGT